MCIRDRYRHSAEELSDLKQAYIESEGDMNHILDNVLCCTFEDEDRFSNQIKDWIEDGEVKRYLDRYKIYIYIVATNSRQRWQKKKCFFFFLARQSPSLFTAVVQVLTQS